jgi:hypothetical protein
VRSSCAISAEKRCSWRSAASIRPSSPSSDERAGRDDEEVEHERADGGDPLGVPVGSERDADHYHAAAVHGAREQPHVFVLVALDRPVHAGQRLHVARELAIGR